MVDRIKEIAKEVRAGRESKACSDALNYQIVTHSCVLPRRRQLGQGVDPDAVKRALDVMRKR